MSKKNLNPAGQSIAVTSGRMLPILRQLKNRSQLELAEFSGVSQTNISAIENNRVQVGKERAVAFAKALNVHPRPGHLSS